MGEKVLDAEISFVALTDEDGKVYGYEIFIAGNGDSGITVTGDTKEECVANAAPYLIDYLTDAENS